jgi:hypothetical protein
MEAPFRALFATSVLKFRTGSKGISAALVRALVTACAAGAMSQSIGGPTDRLPVGGDGLFGTAHPVFVHAFDRNERWMALWQARAELPLKPQGKPEHLRAELYLVIGGGEGTRIDDLPVVSEDGRWLAIVRQKQLELVDSATGEAFALAGAEPAGAGAAQFAGNRLVYIGRRPAGNVLVVHDPAAQAEREIQVADRIEGISWAGEWLAEVVTSPWTAQPCVRAAKAPPCEPTRPSRRLIDLDRQSELAIEPKLLAIIGTTLVRAEPDNKGVDTSLYFDSDPISTSKCNPKIVAVIPAPARVIGVCEHGANQRVLLLGRGVRTNLGPHDFGIYDSLVPFAAPPLLLPSQSPLPEVVCVLGRYCVETASNQPVDLKGGIVHAVWGNKIYLYDYAWPRAHILDALTKRRTPIEAMEIKLEAGRFVVDAKDRLVDLRAGKVLGRVWDAVALSNMGRVLRSRGELVPGWRELVVNQRELWRVSPAPSATQAQVNERLAQTDAESAVDRGPLQWTAPITGETARRQAAQRTRAHRIRHLEELAIEVIGSHGGARITVYGHGQVEYWGMEGAEPEGVRTKKMDADGLLRLKQELERTDFFNLRDVPSRHCPDSTAVWMSVRADGKFKEIGHYTCPSMPQRLIYFEDLFHRIVGTERWIEAERKKERARPGGERKVVQVPADFERKHTKSEVVRFFMQAAGSGNCEAARRLVEMYANRQVSEEQKSDYWYDRAKERGCVLPALKER